MCRADPKTRELEETINEYKNAVYGIAVTMLINKYEAEDVFQEVFLLYFVKQPGFDDPAAKRAWLIRATVNKCRQHNSSKWNRHIDKTADPAALSILETPRDREIYAAVRELPYKYREAVYLRYFLGMPVKEAAAVTGVRANTMSMRLTKARKLLKKHMEGETL